jgi:hypothetical protein
MRRLALVLFFIVLVLGCASAGPASDQAPYSTLHTGAAEERPSIETAGAECAELDSAIGRVRARFEGGLVSVFGMGNDQRRLEALEARSEYLGCGDPNAQPSGWTSY